METPRWFCVSPLAAVVCFFLAGPPRYCHAQFETTEPVGFVTSTVLGGGTFNSPKLNLIAPTVVRPLVWQGTIQSISGTSITVAGNPWTADQFNGANGPYYAEVFSTTRPGALSDITATATNSITTADDLSSFATAGDSIRFRRHLTISDYLGSNNTFGLLASDDPTTGDEVMIYEGANSVSYFYYTGDEFGDPPGWYDSAFTFQAGNVTISPHEGVVIKRKTTANLTLFSTGAVKTGPTLFPIYPALNVLANITAAGLTLDTSGLYNGSSALTASDDIGTADEVQVYDQGPIHSTYWYYDGSLGGSPGWVDLNFNPAGSIALVPGKSFVVNRKVGGALNWSVPGAPQSLPVLDSTLTLTRGTASGSFDLSWYGVDGRNYFIQQSTDLVNWTYVTFNQLGHNATLDWSFTSAEPKLYLRLRYMDPSVPSGQPVATDPVGFITETVGGGTIQSPQLTLIAPTLTQPVSFQGIIASISGTTITVHGATWTDGQFNGSNGPYYVEVFSSTKPAKLSDITATGTSSVTTSDDLSSSASVGDSVRIWPHVTLNSFFGATNTAGLLATNTPATSDEVLIYDGANSVSYFYLAGDDDNDPPGWYDSAFTFQAGAVEIPPHCGVVIKRKTGSALAIISTGAVRTGNTVFPIYSGSNVLATINAAGLTLDSSGLYHGSSGLAGSNDISSADEVLLYSGSVPTTYWYYDGSLGGSTGWYDPGGNLSGSVPIAPGTAFVVNRKVGGALNWTVPLPSPSDTGTNENLNVTRDSVTGSFDLSWYGKAGRSYFIQQSTDMVNWNYVPTIKSGQDASLDWTFTSSASKLFLRLRYSDLPTANPNNTDFDGDKVGALADLLAGLDPFGPYDSNHNGLPDNWENFYFGHLISDPNAASPSGDGMSIADDYAAGVSPTDPAPVLTLSNPAGATLAP